MADMYISNKEDMCANGLIEIAKEIKERNRIEIEKLKLEREKFEFEKKKYQIT